MSVDLELILVPIDRRTIEARGNALIDFLVRRFRYQPDADRKELLQARIARLADNSFADSLSPADPADVYRWLGMAGDVRIADGLYTIEAFFFPTVENSERIGVVVLFDPTLYDTLFQADVLDDDETAIDTEVKRGVMSFCLGVADVLQSDGFVLTFAQAQLTALAVPDLVGRLRVPDEDALRDRPHLLVGIRASTISKVEVAGVWGAEYVSESTNGFVVLDLLKDVDAEEPES